MKSPHTSTSSLNRNRQLQQQQPPRQQQRHHNPPEQAPVPQLFDPYSGFPASSNPSPPFRVSFLEEDIENDNNLSSTPPKAIEQHQSSASANKMVWKRKQQQSPRNRTPTRRQNHKSNQKKDLLQNAPQHSKTPNSPPGYPYVSPSSSSHKKNALSWESFDAATGFTNSSEGFDVESNSDYSSTQTPHSQQSSTAQHRTSATASSSTVTDSTTPSTTITTPGFGDDGSLQQQQQQNSLLTPFVSARHDPQQQAQSFSEDEEDVGIGVPPPPPPPSDISHLLQPPAPEDRSERRRLQYEKEKRRALGGVYEGELEPEGVRGQEAPLLVSTASTNNLPNLRTFDTSAPPPPPPETPNKHVTLLLTPTSRGSAPLSPSQTRAVTPDDLEASLLSPQPPTSPASVGRSRGNNTTRVQTLHYDAATGTTQPLQQHQQQLPNHMPRPILRNSQQMHTLQQPQPSDPPATTDQQSNSSTDSDEELREMRSDLIQGIDENDTEQRALPQQPQHASASNNGSNSNQYGEQEGPSPAAAAAAAAAAQSIKMGRNHAPASNDRPNNTWPQIHPTNDALALSNSDLHKETSDSGVSATASLDVDEWNRLAMQDVEEGRFDQAVARFTRVLEWQVKLHGNPHPAVASAHHNLGTVHAKRASSFPEESPAQIEAQTAALQAFQAAARTARDSLTPHHPNVAVSLVRIGFLLLQSKQYDNAVITFEEALRIRKLAYGAKHSLVANLYNNLGVCQMHLQKFGDGKEALEHALEIQRDLLLSTDASSTHSSGAASVASKRAQSLEVADTLFNIGGLCLEWIRKRGPDLRRQQDAESAFEEALQIRMEMLGREDPLTVQVRDLLQMTRSIPRPRPLTKAEEPADHPHEYEMEAVTPEEVLSISTPPTPSSGRGNETKNNRSGSGRAKARTRPTTPPEFADSKDRYAVSSAANNADLVGRVISPKQSKHRLSTPSSQNARLSAERSLSPGQSRGSVHSIGTKSNQSGSLSASRPMDDFSAITPPATPQSLASSQQQTQSPERQRLNHAKASIRRSTSALLAGNLSPRSGLQTEDEDEGEDEDERFLRHAASTSPIGIRKKNDSRFGEFRDLDGNRLSNMYGGDHGEQQRRTKPIESERSRRHRSDGPPPVNEVTVRSAGDDIVEITTKGTRVFVQPSLVPVSPARDAVVVQENYDMAPLSRGPPEIPQANQYPFDTEENCLIGDTGIDSEYGRVHIPSTWAKAGLVLDEDDPEQRQREIMVTRPSRIDSSKSPERRSGSRSRSRSRSRGRSKSNERRKTSVTAAAEDDDIDYNTGNKERDDIMRRARAFIRAFENGSIDAVSARQADQPSIETDSSSGSFVEESIEDSLQAEDGLAELGGDWITSPRRRHSTIAEMTRDPHNYLPEIFDESCLRLKSDDVAGALPLFEIIFQCQAERYGAVHEHTASALYNLGIAHLRGQNADDALSCFEEATRIRRGALGREHQSVAVSLVKVGITLLLLHRFEDALWNFREALSVRKRSLGSLHPSTARIYNNIGCVHVEFNELREARRAFETALDVQRNALSDDPDSRGIMLATATTLCNLGYLYRHRDLHGKAALVLKEAADLQETVLGRSNPAVLSTLDCLADSSASGGQTSDALRYYNIIITRYRVGGAPGSQTVLRAEAVLLYKMSRVHRQRNDRESQLDTLKLALRSVRALAEPGSTRKDALERRIVYDMRACREQIEKNKMKWI